MSRYRPLWQAARTLSITALCGVALTGCVYRMAIQQGNFLDPAVIAQVKPGMTHSQVRYLLGTPMVPGGFDNTRWDYDYYLKTKRLKKAARGHVAIFFADNVVARVDSDVTEAPMTEFTSRGAQAPEPHGGGVH